MLQLNPGKKPQSRSLRTALPNPFCYLDLESSHELEGTVAWLRNGSEPCWVLESQQRWVIWEAGGRAFLSYDLAQP